MTGRRGVFWPLVLIAVGLVFLLANFGYISPISVVALLSLWPLLLVLAGIDIAFARRWPLATLVAEVVVIGFGLALLAARPPLFAGDWFSFGTDGSGGESDISVRRDSVGSLALRLSGGAGTFRVSGGSTQLVEAHSGRADLRLRRNERSGDRADIRIDQGASGGPRFGGRPAADVETKIASDVPTSLELNYGAGDFNIDLRELRITDVRLNVGASSLQLALPKPSGDVPVTVNAGASSVVIVVPDGVEARVSTTGAITSMRSDNARLSAAGGSAETAGFASARDRVTVRVTAGASSITVR